MQVLHLKKKKKKLILKLMVEIWNLPCQANKYLEYLSPLVFFPNLQFINWGNKLIWASLFLTFTKWELMIESNLSAPTKSINFGVSPTIETTQASDLQSPDLGSSKSWTMFSTISTSQWQGKLLNRRNNALLSVYTVVCSFHFCCV